MDPVLEPAGEFADAPFKPVRGGGKDISIRLGGDLIRYTINRFTSPSTTTAGVTMSSSASQTTTRTSAVIPRCST